MRGFISHDPKRNGGRLEFWSDRFKIAFCSKLDPERVLARPREFDNEAVLDAATESFWTRGYEATSTRDLIARMGITGASLYNAFGDKRALYRQVLDRYAASALKDCNDAFNSGGTPLDALTGFFDAIVAQAADDRQRKGCFVVNTALELAPHDDEFRELVSDVFLRIEMLLRDCITAGQKDGSIGSTQPPGELARLLLSTFLGIRVLARVRPDPGLLKDITRPVFQLLALRQHR